MNIHITKDPRTKEWLIPIPASMWNDFQEYANELRMHWQLKEPKQSVVIITLHEAYRKSDVTERIEFFFDGIGTVNIKEK